MTRIITIAAVNLGLGLLVASSGGGLAIAQTSGERPDHIPTQQNQNSPYGTQWAKPGGTTGSHIYNDPRRIDPHRAYKPNQSRGCSAPKLYDPATGGCR